MMEEGEKTLRAAGGAVLSVKLWWSKQKRGLHPLMYQYFWIIAIKASYETFLDLFFYQICNYTEVYIFVATY